MIKIRRKPNKRRRDTAFLIIGGLLLSFIFLLFGAIGVRGIASADEATITIDEATFLQDTSWLTREFNLVDSYDFTAGEYTEFASKYGIQRTVSSQGDIVPVFSPSNELKLNYSSDYDLIELEFCPLDSNNSLDYECYAGSLIIYCKFPARTFVPIRTSMINEDDLQDIYNTYSGTRNSNIGLYEIHFYKSREKDLTSDFYAPLDYNIRSLEREDEGLICLTAVGQNEPIVESRTHIELIPGQADSFYCGVLSALNCTASVTANYNNTASYTAESAEYQVCESEKSRGFASASNALSELSLLFPPNGSGGHNHRGDLGTWDCTHHATCELCGESYEDYSLGEFDKHNYTVAVYVDSNENEYRLPYYILRGGVVDEAFNSEDNTYNGISVTLSGFSETDVCTACGLHCCEVHSGGQATCQVKARCEVCDKYYGELAPHSGGHADCQHKAICEHCGEEYGLIGLHNYLDENGHVTDVCTICGHVANGDYTDGGQDTSTKPSDSGKFGKGSAIGKSYKLAENAFERILVILIIVIICYLIIKFRIFNFRRRK